MSTRHGPTLDLRCHLSRGAFTLDVDVQLPTQGVSVLFGPSGSGKTTLLRCLAGLERATTGYVRMGEALWQDSAHGVFVPTWQRRLGYVFQEASLFAHMDVRRNVEYGLRHHHAALPRTALDKAMEVVEVLDIGHLLHRRPAQLSGGERQRVALARALAPQPQLLLLDEPLAALGAAHKADILAWLERLRDVLHIPMVYVTHAPDEVARLADTVVQLANGHVQAVQTVADALAYGPGLAQQGDGPSTLIEGVVASIDAPWHLAEVRFAGGSIWLPRGPLAVGHTLRLRVLARDVSISTVPPQHTSIQNLLPCTVLRVEPPIPHNGAGHAATGAQCMVHLQCAQTTLLARITARAAHQLALHAGQPVWAQLKSAAIERTAA